MKIVIDPGHGGEQSGAVYGGIREADENLAVCLATTRTLLELNHAVMMTRDKDETLTLLQRLEIIDKYKADIFVSVHCNADNSDKSNGVETYYRDDGDYALANSIQTILVRYTGRRDIGVLQDEKRLGKRITVLNNYSVPSALVEIGFLSNENDRKYILASHETIGQCIAHGIDYYAHIKAGKEKLTWPVLL